MAIILAWFLYACFGSVSYHADDDGTRYSIYVANESSDEVDLVTFDGEEARVAARIPVGYQPTENEGPHGLTVSPDGAHWYLSMAHGIPNGWLYKYETGTNRLLGRVELGLFPATMQISERTGLLYCVNFDLHGDMSPSTVSIVDPDAMVEVARTRTGAMPHGSRLTKDGAQHYSCAMMDGFLFEMDAATFQVTRVLDLNPETEGVPPPERLREEGPHDHKLRPGQRVPKPTWVQPHPSRPVAYVALNGMDEIVEVDLKAWRIVRRFETGRGPYNLDVSADGTRLVASYKTGAQIGVWDLDEGRELRRLRASRRVTHGVVISPDSRFAFVTNEGIGATKGTVDVVDLRTLRIVSTVECALQTGGIAFWKLERG
ncbi:MAG: YncE family protein [Planctomycetes bacterium]|nr:YncE family protein [Planctomycetota bacterium]